LGGQFVLAHLNRGPVAVSKLTKDPGALDTCATAIARLAGNAASANNRIVVLFLKVNIAPKSASLSDSTHELLVRSGD
jgi:hypothetical protein